MKKYILLLALTVMVSGCATTNATSTIVQDIQEVDIGDSIDEVVSKVGNPHEVWSKEITSDNKEKIVYTIDSNSFMQQLAKPERSSATPPVNASKNRNGATTRWIALTAKMNEIAVRNFLMLVRTS